jgi:hypothetical protein
VLRHNDPAMNKRTYLKLLAMLISKCAVSAMFAWAADQKLTNWAGNLIYGTYHLHSANSLPHVRDYVVARRAAKWDNVIVAYT